jgi:hypothetical protein
MEVGKEFSSLVDRSLNIESGIRKCPFVGLFMYRLLLGSCMISLISLDQANFDPRLAGSWFHLCARIFGALLDNLTI